MRDRIYDVAIIGYGPVGAILANILGRSGVSVLSVDAAADIYDKPRAINIDHEVMRVLQSIDLADRILPGTVPHPGTDFLGLEGKTIKIFDPPPPPYPLHWQPNLMFIQPEFERVVRAGAEAHSSVEIRLSTECTGFEDLGEMVKIRLRKGSDVTTTYARYLVACDGAASSTRRRLSIASESLDFDESWTVVDAWLTRETQLPHRTTQYCLPDRPATYVVGPRNLRRWEMKLLPGERASDFENLDYLKTRLSAFVDPDALDLWRVATYRFHALVANEWQRGRIFLAGDAAHQMPPFMAQGLCSGIRDVGNLGWKLTGVLKGVYDPALLDTYELERKPHIAGLTAVTKGIGKIIGELDYAKAAERDREMISEMQSGQSVRLRQALIPNIVAGLIAKDENGGSAFLAGHLFPQSRVARLGNIQLLDDVIGDRFAIVTRDGYAARGAAKNLPVERLVQLHLSSTEGAPVDDGIIDLDGTVVKWMERENIQAVVVRPDKYIFGTARATDELDRLICELLAAVPYTSEKLS